MPLFNESLESIAQAIVTVKRALKAGVIEKGDYKGLNDYLAKRSKDFGITKKHLARANKDLDVELEVAAEEFFMDEGDALCNMAEDLLEEFNEKPAAEVELTADEKADCDAWLDEVKVLVKAKQAVVMAEQKAQKAWAKLQGAAEVEVGLTADEKAKTAWMKMDDEERAAMAVLVSEWKR